jgi:hypothetical protein
MAHPVGNDPTSQALQASANPSQLWVVLKLVDPTRIELATDALQVLLAPKVHAGPS